MSFNAFTWNNGQPQPTQNISSGQATLLNDIQFLGYAVGSTMPGWIQLPNGLIIQWGHSGPLAMQPAVNALTFASPAMGMKTFPTNLFLVIPVIRSSSTNNDNRSVWISTLGFSASGFTLISQDLLNTGCDILAIGN